MSDLIPALYCDGATLASRPVTIEFTDDGSLRIVGESLDQSHPLAAIQASTRLARVPRFLRLANGATLEVPETGALPALDFAHRGSRLVTLLNTLESRSAAAAAATLLLVCGLVGSLWLGLPALARRAAFAVPVSLEQKVGRTAFAVFDRQLGVTQLNSRELRLAGEPFARLLKVRAGHLKPALVFRSMNVANAFAMPGGPIVVSDKLVRLALKERNGPDLLAAVYAHELGHIEQRHGLQIILHNSAALLAVATITGDLSTLTTFSGTLPFLLVQRGYAREFEREADNDAAERLRAAGMEPALLAEMLELLETERTATGPDFSYLSTHPSTTERIKALRNSDSAKPR